MSFSEAEKSMLQEALESLRKVKLNALACVNVALGSDARVLPFSKADFGVDVIDSLLKRLAAF